MRTPHSEFIGPVRSAPADSVVWCGARNWRETNREGELLGLRKSDVDMVAGTIAVRRSYDDADTSKGGHADLIPIAAGLRSYLAEAMLSARGEYVFPDTEGRRCSKCNMKLWPKAIPRPMRFHDLRGTTATLLARSGVGLVVAQRILRHCDPRLTANIYSRVDLADLQAGIDRLGIPPAAEG